MVEGEGDTQSRLRTDHKPVPSVLGDRIAGKDYSDI